MTDTVGYRPDDWWTIDDLLQLPDDGMRYELVDGCLLMSPSASPHHGKAQFYLRELLQRQATDGIAVSGDVGIEIGSKYTYSSRTFTSFRLRRSTRTRSTCCRPR